jgi:hypothetical protein
MADDIFRTVRELLESSDCVLMGNAVNTEGKLYDDSVANLTAILELKAMLDRAEVMQEFTDDVWIKVNRYDWEAFFMEEAA